MIRNYTPRRLELAGGASFEGWGRADAYGRRIARRTIRTVIMGMDHQNGSPSRGRATSIPMPKSASQVALRPTHSAGEMSDEQVDQARSVLGIREAVTVDVGAACSVVGAGVECLQ